MLFRVRNSGSSSAFSARALALLAAAALVALTAVGCDGLPPASDCSFKPSTCTSITMAVLCPASGACTVDSAPAKCTETSCTLESGQKLTIPLDGIDIAAKPDLLFKLVGANLAEGNLHMKIDGKELPGVAEPAAAPYFLVKWADASSAPKALEVSFVAGPGPQEMEVLLSDVQCHLDELSACHSGGA